MAGQGSLIVATDYNSIQTSISNTLGTGSGLYGYGQTVLSGQVAAYAKISTTQWQNLRTDILRARQHQTGTDLTASLTTATSSVKITETDRAAYATMASDAALTANRLVAPPAAQATREDLVSQQTIPANWNGDYRQIITVTFPSADAARWYFNTGSRFEFSSRIINSGTYVSPTKNYTWDTMFTTMGTVYFGVNDTTCTGVGSGSAIGFAQLTTSDQLVFSKLAPAGAYSANKLYIYARAPSSTQVVITIQWRDDSPQPNPPYGIDENVATVYSTAQVYRSSGSNVSVSLPPASTTAPASF